MRRRVPWLLVGALLFAAAAWLMARGDEPASARSEAPRVRFPRRLRPPESERMQKRRTLPAAPAEADAEDEGAAKPALRDPMLAALPSGEGRTTVVLEANALTHSPVGAMLLECLRAQSGGEDPFAKLKEQTGLDPLQQVDRVAMSDDVVLVSGHFADARWSGLFADATSRSLGDRGTVYYPRGADGSPVARGFAVWDDQMLVFGDSDAEIARTIDRLEGRAEPGEPAISEQATYGEIYGVVDAATLAKLLPEGGENLAGLLRDTAQRIELHVDARGDVGISAKVEGRDAAGVDELSRSLGAALAVARLKAKAEGEDDLVELLDLARVSPEGTGFDLELALPMALLEKHLSNCGRPADPVSEPSGP